MAVGKGNRPLASANVSATRRGYLQLLGMERRARGAAAEPGRCQRGGSNDDLYPLLPVLLPTRDNTNHYHRLITGITANIEIMHACACAYVRASERACVRAYFASWPCEGCCSLPYFFFTTHSSFLSGRSAAAPYSTTLPASSPRYGPRRQPRPSQVRASAERSAACAAGDLPERSLDGRKAEGGVQRGQRVLCAAKGFLARGRQEGRRSKTPRACFARILLRSAVVLFSRNSPTWVHLKDEIHLRQAVAKSKIFPYWHLKLTARGDSPSFRYSARKVHDGVNTRHFFPFCSYFIPY